MSEDVLVKWSLFITESASRSKYVFDECVGDLAAEVRAQREQIKAYVVCNEANLAEIAVLRARVAELETQLAELDAQRIADYDDTELGREMREKESRGIA